MAAYTLTGFEGAADLAEESHEPRRTVPSAMVLSIIISAVLGFIVLLGFELATPDPAAIQSSSVPLLDIASHYLGALTPAFMALVFVSIYACGLINMAAMTRLAFSMSRDDILPFSKAISSASSRNSPYIAVVVATIISSAFVLVAKVEAIITSVSAVAIYCSYALVILGGWRVGQEPLAGKYFSLGRAFKPLSALEASLDLCAGHRVAHRPRQLDHPTNLARRSRTRVSVVFRRRPQSRRWSSPLNWSGPHGAELPPGP